MSADDEDSGGEAPYVSQPMVRGNQRLNASLPMGFNPDTDLDRRTLGMLGTRSEPTIWEAVNYPESHQFTFSTFWLRYRRQAEAKAIIDKPVNDTWQDAPEVIDEASGAESEDKTDFERDVEQFFEGEHTRRKPIHRFNVAHKLARLGEFAIIVFGFTDGRELNTPIGGVEDDTEAELDGPEDLMYMSVFGQDRIVNIERNTDMTSPRFRLPETYEVITEELDDDVDRETGNLDPDRDDVETEEIHWTRVIHVPEGTMEDDLRGEPALKAVFHELLNIDKIKAASAEGFWRGGYVGFHVSPPKDASGRLMDWDDDGEGVKEEMRDFFDHMDRTVNTPGEVEALSSSVDNPVPHLEANYQSISAALDIPKSMLTGKDRADTADAEDKSQWHQKVGQIRNTFADPVMASPSVQRLIDVGVFTEPDGEGFDVDWPALDELTEKEQREIDKLLSETVTNLGSPAALTFGSVPELRHKIGWSPEVGTELPEDFEPEEPDEDELEVDEQQLEEFQAFLDNMDEPLPDDLQDQPPPDGGSGEEA